MCVASGEWSTSTGSNPKDSTPSNRRSPAPSRTGATSRTSSSMAPAASAWRTVDAPPAMSTPRSPAAARACSSAASKPWVTKWKLVPPSISIGSRAWWPQQVELSSPVHRTLDELELVHSTFGLSLTVRQDHRCYHRFYVLKQLDGESLQFWYSGRFGLLCPFLQPRSGLLFGALLLVSEHPGKLLEQGAASLCKLVYRLQPLERPKLFFGVVLWPLHEDPRGLAGRDTWRSVR